MLGNLANGLTNCTAPEYRLKTYDGSAHPVEVTADTEGGVWLPVGVDSEFEATTSVELTAISARLTPR